MMGKLKAFILVLVTVVFLGGFINTVIADTVYLKNGNIIEGMVVKEDAKGIELELGFGTMKIEKDLILKTQKSTIEETRQLYQKWEKQKSEAGERDQKARRIREEWLQKQTEVPPQDFSSTQETPRGDFQPKKVEVDLQGRHISVDALLNNRVQARLLLDTGATMVLLSNKIAKQLGIDMNFDSENKEMMVSLILADGRRISARYVRLESVKVQKSEVYDVAAAALFDDTVLPDLSDGLLGMSFLKKFNFKVDQENNRIILEELRER